VHQTLSAVPQRDEFFVGQRRKQIGVHFPNMRLRRCRSSQSSCHNQTDLLPGFPSGRLTSSNEGTWVLFHHDSSAAPQTVQTALPVCGTDGKLSSVELGIIPFLRTHLVFPCQPSECLAIHSAACCSVAKPLTTSVSPSGQRTSTTQPNPGLPFRATKAGRYSDISGICAYGAPVQAGRPTTIKPTDRNLRSMAIVHLRKPLVRAWLLRVRWHSRRQLAASGSRKSARG
jgi:hypothetical protein